MGNNLLDTKTISLGELLGNGKIYQVPPYQRDYSWEEENWEDLWQDILTLTNEAGIHYMGSIVLQSKDRKKFTIIDGQQRIATLSVIIMTAVKRLQDLIEAGVESADNQERQEILRRKFLGDKDPASLRYSSKLFLNENNNSFYQSHVLQLKEPLNITRLNDSEKLIWGAYQYFYSQITKVKFTHDGEKIASFINDLIAERLLFIQITVEDELNAYTVFETLNARGLELTSTDLLKNYLFSLVSKADLNLVRIQWERIVDIIGIKDFPAFLRHYLNSLDKLVRRERLFKQIKSKVKNAVQVFDLLDRLEKAAGLYSSLRSSTDEYWVDKPKLRERVQELELFRVTQPMPFLIACFESLDFTAIEKVLRMVSVISFRYQVIGGLNTNILEDIYNRAALEVRKNPASTPQSLFSQLKEAYPSDESFVQAFATKKMNTRKNKRMVKYILCALERHMGYQDCNEWTTPGTIEHVLPENLSSSWEQEWSNEDHQNFVNRLGNYCLLETKLNSRYAGNEDFKLKLEVYSRSQYRTAQEVSSFEEWTKHVIDSRQRGMAKIASGIWRIDY